MYVCCTLVRPLPIASCFLSLRLISNVSHCSRKAATNAVDSRVGRRKGEIDPDEDIKGGIEDEDEERFRRLRTAYFNSPDYDRSERPSSVEKLIRKEEEEEEKEKSLPQLGTAHSTPTKSVETSLLKQPKERKSI